MNPEVKEAWIDALLSGEYEQGLNLLHREAGGKVTWCCLGVLCDLAVTAGVPLTVTTETDDDGGLVTKYDEALNYPPDAVVEWAGLTPRNYYWNETSQRGNQLNLAVANDSGVPFTEIAETIRTYL